ncbi:MAG: Thiol-disulfide oxidoreductase ResA [Verrucomicrobiota bacterium]
MKNSISKPVLVVVGLGLLLIVALLWFGLHRQNKSAPPAPVAVEKPAAATAPAFLQKPISTPAKPAPKVVVADDHLLPVIPISLLKTLSEDPAYNGSAMSSLPSGTQKYGGIEFWLQGILRLQGTGTRDFESSHFRTSVVVPLDETNGATGVVWERGKNIAAAYILGGSLYSSEKSHEKIADVLWHYDDDTVSSPLEANRHLRDWVRQTYEEPARLPNPLTKIAWHGPHPTRTDVTLRLYRIGFINPHPEKTVRAIEFLSAMKKPSLFVAALTLDPLLPGARPDNLTSEEFGDPELRGLLQLSVQDAEGRPISGADVRSGFNAWNKGSPARHATTDVAGLAQVRYDDAAESLEVNAEADGFSGRMMLWDVKGGDQIPATYILKLTPELKLGGIVVNAENLPVAGASVTTYRFWRGPISNGKGEQASYSRQALTTDAQGRWQAKGVPPTLLDSIGFNVSHPDYVTANNVSGISGAVEQQLRAGTYKTVLQRGQSVRGRVVDGQEQPVASASVRVGQKYSSDRKETKTDADGRFTFSAVKTDEVLFSASAKGFSSEAKNILVKADMAEIIFRLKAGSTIRGHVQDESAQPLAGTRVNLSGNYGDPLYDANDFSATTDANGDFSWDSAPNQAMKFDVNKSGFESKSAKLEPNQDNTITLRPARTVEGVVLDAASGQPVTNFTVTVGQTSGDDKSIYGRMQKKLFNTPDGKFSVTTEDESENAVSVSAESYADKIEKFPEANNGAVQLTVRLTPSETLSGVVLAPDGTPAPNITVAAIETGNWNGGVQLTGSRLRAYGSQAHATETDSEGRFKISSPPEKGLVVAAADAGFGQAEISEVRASKILALQAWGRIEGTLKIGSQPAVGKELLFTLPIRSISTDFNGFKVTTDEQGAFTMEKIPPGEGSIVRLIKTSANSWSHSDSTSVTVKPGETTQVTLGDNGAVLVGRIRYAVQPTNETPISIQGNLSSTAPMPAAPKFNTPAESQAYYNSPEMQALMRQRKNYSIEMRPDGAFTADNVVPGKYSLSITARAGRDWSQPAIAQGSAPEITVPDDFDPATPIDAGEVVLQPSPPR